MKDKSSILRKSIKMGSVEHETKVSNKEGEIMAIASKDVISIPPTKSIKDTAKVMMEHEFRRLPIADPGSGKVLGIVTVMDILDFFGGGKKFNIIEKKYEDNFLAAINEPIREIMTRDVICLSDKSSIKDTIETMLSNQIGAIPLVDADDKLAGIVTERDIVLMVRNGLRRIPIVGGEADISKASKKLLGIVTSTDIIRYFNAKELFDNLNSNAASEVLKNIVSNIMAEDPITVSQTERIGDICALFAEKNIGGVPVTKDGEIIGIITEKDILNAIKTL